MQTAYAKNDLPMQMPMQVAYAKIGISK